MPQDQAGVLGRGLAPGVKGHPERKRWLGRKAEVPPQEDPTRRGVSLCEAQGRGAALPIWGSPYAARAPGPGTLRKASSHSCIGETVLRDAY